MAKPVHDGYLLVGAVAAWYYWAVSDIPIDTQVRLPKMTKTAHLRPHFATFLVEHTNIQNALGYSDQS